MARGPNLALSPVQLTLLIPECSAGVVAPQSEGLFIEGRSYDFIGLLLSFLFFYMHY